MAKKKKKQANNFRHDQNQHLGSSIKRMTASLKPSGGAGKNLLYQQNLKTLERYYPELATRIKETTIGKYELISAKQGQAPNLQIKELNRTYYSPANPMDDVKEQLESLGLKNNRLAIFLGMGLGYELAYYIQKMAANQNTHYMLVIEKDLEIFKAAMQAIDLRESIKHDHIKFLVGFTAEALYVQLRNYLSEKSRFKYLRAMKPVYHQASLLLHKDYYLSALKNLRESGTDHILNFGNCPEDSLIGIENMLENIDEIIYNPGINLLFDKFKGKPAVVIATGPSLNKNKHLLKGLADKALLVAADASLKIMLEMGVKPHLVTSLERVPATAKLFSGIEVDQVSDVYFAGCPVVRNEVYQAYPGPRIIVYRNLDHFRWLGIDRGILDIKLSAGNMAFKVAEALGCDPIILIGQDLAYGQEGITHAKGAALGEIQGKKKKRKTLHIKGNDGKPILTTETWYSFMKAYELDVAGYRGKCINSTEGGAYIEGTEVMPFQESIECYIRKPFYPLNMIKKHLSSFRAEQTYDDYHSLSELIQKTTEDVRTIIEQCNLGIQLYQKYKPYLNEILTNNCPKPGTKEIDAIALEMLQPKNICMKDYHHTFQLFLTHVIQSFTVRFEMEMIAIPEKHNHTTTAKAETLLRTSEWYITVRDIAQVCLKLLEKSADKLSKAKPESDHSKKACM